MTDLGSAIVYIVNAIAGITSNGVCRELKARKSEVIDELERLRQEGLLRFENGPRGSRCWYTVAGPGNQFPDAARGPSGESGHADTETMP